MSNHPPSRLRTTLLGAAALLASGAWQAKAAEPTRLALVIGQGAYVRPPALPACTDAARQVSTALIGLGYRVTQVQDLTLGQLAATIAAFGRSLAAAPEARPVAYFCGQLASFDGRAFLLPVSAQIGRPTEVISQGFLARGLAQALLRPGAPGGLLLVDAAAAPPDGGDAARELSGTAGGVAIASAGRPVLAEALAELAPALQDGTPAAILSGIQARLAGRQDIALRRHAETEDRPTLPSSPLPTAAGAASPSAPAAIVQEAPAEPAPKVAAPPVPEAPALPAPPPAARPSTAPPGHEPQFNRQQRRFIQGVLWRLGYYAGPTDGVFGAETRAAIRRYQSASGEPQTGELSPPQGRRLLFTMR